MQVRYRYKKWVSIFINIYAYIYECKEWDGEEMSLACFGHIRQGLL